jgi:hypothetical protein
MTESDIFVPVLQALTLDDWTDLEGAVALLETPGFFARLSDLLGKPVEVVMDRLPSGAASTIDGATRRALRAALALALSTLKTSHRGEARNRTHALAAGLTGAAGGAFGLASLAVELPMTTTIILRSVADVARSEGEDLSSVETRLACLEVFALGGRSGADDAAESGYFAVRTALAQAVNEAARYLSRRTTVEKGAPVIARLVAAIASRFNSVVAEKIVAQGVPVIGALGGAGVNVAFARHFQAMARGHFVVRRLERTYGEDVIREAYDRIVRGERLVRGELS